MVALSLLDLALIGPDESPAEALDAVVTVAKQAEAGGYRRIWYAEHHNMESIASSATSVVIAHVAAATESIRVGSGGIMLPNHSPLVIAEQFGTLATLHPGRIDLGLGRAPGTDQRTWRALRRDPAAAERFPDDVLELQGYLSGQSRVPGISAVPGAGTNVPLYILGSSLFGARLAAALGLPYAFASHFAPELLQQAVAVYRAEFQPSEQQPEPHVMAGVNVVAADTDAEADALIAAALRHRVARFLARGRELTTDQLDALVASPQGQQIARMSTYRAVGSPARVVEHLDEFTRHADADELMTVHPGPTREARLRSVELLAEAA